MAYLTGAKFNKCALSVPLRVLCLCKEIVVGAGGHLFLSFLWLLFLKSDTFYHKFNHFWLKVIKCPNYMRFSFHYVCRWIFYRFLLLFICFGFSFCLGFFVYLFVCFLHLCVLISGLIITCSLWYEFPSASDELSNPRVQLLFYALECKWRNGNISMWSKNQI